MGRPLPIGRNNLKLHRVGLSPEREDGQTFALGFQRMLGLRKREPGTEAGNEVVAVLLVDGQPGVGLRAPEEPEGRWHDTDDNVRVVGEGERLADDMGIPVEGALPEPVAHDDRVVRLQVVACEGPSDLRPHAKESREVRRESPHAQVLVDAGGECRGARSAIRPEVLEDAGEHPRRVDISANERKRWLSLQVLAVVNNCPGAPQDEDQPVGVLVGNRSKQRGIDDAEDGSICSDTERESQDRGGRESAIARKEPDGMPQVADDGVDPAAACLANCFLRLCHAAEIPERHAPRLRRLHAAVDVCPGLHLDVKAKLLVHLGVDGIPPDQPLHVRKHARQHGLLRWPSTPCATPAA